MRKSAILFVITLNTLSMLGVGLLSPVYPIFVTNTFSASIVDIGILSAVFCLTAAFFKAPAGKLVDAFGKEKVFFIGVLLSAVCSLAYIFASNITQLYLIEFLYGMAYALQRPALLVLMVEVSEKDNRGLFLGMFESVYDITQAAAALLSVVIVSKMGFESLFLTCFGCQAMTGFLIIKSKNVSSKC